MRHKSRVLIAVVGFELLALSACGYSVANDTQLTEALGWARDFKAEQPELSRQLARSCQKELTNSPYWSREGALQLFTCVRREAEARGYA